MFKFLFLIPLVLMLLWTAYLKQNNYSLAQGKQGFMYIGVISGTILLGFGLLMFLMQ
jgi:hypothetical protein